MHQTVANFFTKLQAPTRQLERKKDSLAHCILIHSSPSANQYFPLFLNISYSCNTALTLFPTHCTSKAGTRLLMSIRNDGPAPQGDADLSGFAKQTNIWKSREQEMKPGCLELEMRVKVQPALGFIYTSHIFVIWFGQT